MEENKNNINDNETESINLIKKENPIEEKKIEEVKPVTPVPESMPNPEGKKKGSVAVVILTVVIILLVIGLIYMLVFYKDKDEGKDNNDNPKPAPTPTVTPTATPGVTPTPTPEPTSDAEKKNELVVYKNTSGNYLTEETKKEDYLDIAFTIKTNTKNAKVLSVNYFSVSLVLYDDNGLYIYNDKTKSSEKVDLENIYKEYRIYLNEDNNKVIGIGYADNNNKFTYYNVLKKTKLYDGKYKVDDGFWSVSQINDHYLSIRSDKTVYLLSSETESTKLTYKDDTDMIMFDSIGEKGDYIYDLSASPDDTYYMKFYSKDFKLFYEIKKDDEPIEENNVSFYNKTLYLYVDKKLYKYNTNGELIDTITSYDDAQMLINNYVVYTKDNKIILENIENSNESKVLMNDVGNVDAFTSGYYSRETLDRLGEKNKKEGLYVVIYYGYGSDGEEKKDAKGNYGMEYCYTPDKQVVEYPIKEAMGGRAKPVLYLYPEEETKVEVKFAHPEYLTTTYPKYNGSWEVTAKPNGDLTDKDGKYYYALYWDETRYSETDFSEGFYVESKDAIKFLEEKLTIIGLNAKERNEFIMYWLPIMENNKKNLVYFELTDEREANNKLIITPTPDSLLRVSIHIKKVNEKVNIKEQKLPTFNRTGFAAIEWGGMTY